MGWSWLASPIRRRRHLRAAPALRPAPAGLDATPGGRCWRARRDRGMMSPAAPPALARAAFLGAPAAKTAGPILVARADEVIE
jgi:hypothetical protein